MDIGSMRQRIFLKGRQMILIVSMTVCGIKSPAINRKDAITMIGMIT